jgi:hypothetical protein
MLSPTHWPWFAVDNGRVPAKMSALCSETDLPKATTFPGFGLARLWEFADG